MAIVKVIELLAEGNSIEDAVNAALQEAAKTIRNIRSIYVQDIQAYIGSDNKVSKYRINARVSFVIDH